jgi:hypothetical protein
MRSASEKAAAVSALRNDVKQMELRAGAKKTLKLTVECPRCSRFAPRSLFNFNCGIRIDAKKRGASGLASRNPWHRSEQRTSTHERHDGVDRIFIEPNTAASLAAIEGKVQ